ncbi:MAG: hypothetical protein AABM30_04945 [Actinomycetota bacterium]
MAATKTVGVLLIAAAMLVGCRENEQSAAEKAAMNARFAELDYAISNMTLSAPPYQENLEPLTDQYVEAIRKYADDLGDGEVNRRLAEKAAELAPFCLPCADVLDRERENH